MTLWTVLAGLCKGQGRVWGGRGVLESFLSNRCPRTARGIPGGSEAQAGLRLELQAQTRGLNLS